MTATPDHWNQHARRFEHFGSPLRPVADDIEAAEAMAADAANARAASQTARLRALVLGVTPEVVAMHWPAGTHVLAVDRNRAMIDAFYPAEPTAASTAVVCGEWRELPVRDASMDIVAGDGCYILLDPAGHQILTRQVRRVLTRDGRFIMRHFVRPEQPEKLADVFADLDAGRIGSFHVFKWRLAMALHGSLREGVCLADMWQAWDELGPGTQALADRLGWPAEQIETIDNYRGVPTCYHFPTLAEVRAGFADRFEEVAMHVPAYELGDRCPTLALAPRRA